MKYKINGNLVRAFFIFSFFLFAQATVSAQDNFPEGPGREAIFVACTQCHGLNRLTRVRLNAMEWENALYDMMARGAVVDIKDLNNVRNYLVKNFAVKK